MSGTRLRIGFGLLMMSRTWKCLPSKVGRSSANIAWVIWMASSSISKRSETDGNS